MKQILTILFLYTHLTSGQTTRNFTTEEGLPSNEVYSSFQDKNGLIWFATDRGICHYNGLEFKKYEPKNLLTDITVFDFFPQENGQVWCNTFNNKLFYFENGGNTFTPYKYNHLIINYIKKHQLINFIIKKIAVDKTGTVHLSNGELYFTISKTGKIKEIINKHKEVKKVVSLNSKGISTFKINKEQVLNCFSSNKGKFILPKLKGRIRSLKQINSKTILVVTDSLVNLVNSDNRKVNLDYGKKTPMSGGKWTESTFWIGYRNEGVYIYDLNFKLLNHYLPNITVSSINKDCFGGIWITTLDYGVYYIQDNIVKINKALSSAIESLALDQKNTLFVGLSNGDIYKKTKGKTVLYSKSIEGRGGCVSFFPLLRTVIYCNGKEMFFGKKKFLKGDGVLKISEDNFNTISYCKYNIYYIYNGKNIISDTLNFRIHDISYVDEKLFFGSSTGLKIINKGKLFNRKDILFNCRIDDIDYNKKTQTFFLATLGKGVVVYNKKLNTVFAIDKNKGLSNNLVTEVYIEDKNTIWACTTYGLNRIKFYSPTKYSVEYLTTTNGLISNQIKDVEVTRDSIFIGTSKGLCSFSKHDYNKLLKHKKYFLRIKQIDVLGKKIAFENDQLNLKYYQNQIEFYVDLVSLSKINKITYQYKLIGLDKDWKISGDGKINYSFIPSGDYALRVRIIDDGRLNCKEEIVIDINISEPFWNEIWFKFLLAIAISTVFYFFFKIRVLTYNKDIVRELIRILLKKLNKEQNIYFTFKEHGNTVRVKTSDVLYVRSSGNYIDIVTETKTHVVRAKIGDFIMMVKDPLEFLRIHRSFIVRIDKIQQKSKKAVYIKEYEIPVGETYLDELEKIMF